MKSQYKSDIVWIVVALTISLMCWVAGTYGGADEKRKPLPGDQKTVIVEFHKDGHWYPVNTTDWEWYGRLDGFLPSKPLSIDDPSTYPKILNF